MRLEGMTAIVSGAGSGFGEGIAKRFAAEGAKILANDIDAEAVDRGTAEIGAAGGTATSHVGDVGRDQDVARMIGAAVEAFGGLDVLVNNAGVPQRNMSMLEVDEATFDQIFRVNVKSIYLAAKHGVPALRARGGGAIINTASTAALRPRPGLTWYNGSKGAVTTITKSMALELAPDKIRVNAICPVIADNAMTIEFMGGVDTPEIREKFIATIPLGRMSTPIDIANAALFLASPEAEFITGVCLEVDGGRCV